MRIGIHWWSKWPWNTAHWSRSFGSKFQDLKVSYFERSTSTLGPMASGLEQPEPEQIGSAAEELHEAPTIHPAVREIASQVSGMEPAGPSILRATQAYNVLQSGGRALRWMNRDLYSHSAPVSSIQEFWSHSWHGSRYLKTILLMLLYNGPAATVAATLSALVMMSLQATNVLPGYDTCLRCSINFYPLLYFYWFVLVVSLTFPTKMTPAILLPSLYFVHGLCRVQILGR